MNKLYQCLLQPALITEGCNSSRLSLYIELPVESFYPNLI